jgi:hypothetical protein
MLVLLHGGIGGEAAGRRRCGQGDGAVLAGADLGQPAADEGPAGPAGGEPGFADGDDISGGQFPGRFNRVAGPLSCGRI